MRSQEYILAYLQGRTNKPAHSSIIGGKDWSTNNRIVYSYGSHYPLATIIDGKAYINNTGYSMTTSKHIGWAISACAQIVGWDNVYTVHLNGTTFDRAHIAQSAQQQAQSIRATMEAKKRKNTAVYADLERQYANACSTYVSALEAIHDGDKVAI